MITETKQKRVEKIQVLLASMQKTFECPICLELMKNPISTRCGHKFCRHCIHEAIGRKAQAPCPLCKVSFSKRSLTSLPRWNEIVTGIRSLVVAYQLDTGFEFSTPHGPLCCSPLSSTPASQQSSSSSSQQRKRTAQGSSAAEKIAKKRKTQDTGIFIDADALSSVPEELVRTNINISSSFPRKSSTVGKPKGPEETKSSGPSKSSTGSSTESMEPEGSSEQESKKSVENLEEPAHDEDGFNAVKDGTDSYDLLSSVGFQEHFISETDEDAKALSGKNGNSQGAANDGDNEMETGLHTENQDENNEHLAPESGSISSTHEQNMESVDVLPDTEPESNVAMIPSARQKRNTKLAKTDGKPQTPSLSAKSGGTDEKTRISEISCNDSPQTKRRSKRHLRGNKDIDPSSQTSEVQHSDEPGMSLLESLSSTAKKETTPTQGRRGKRGLAKKGSPVLQPESSICEAVQEKNSSGDCKIPEAAQEDSEDDLPQRKSDSRVKRRRKADGSDGSNTRVSEQDEWTGVNQSDRQPVETDGNSEGNMSKGTPQSLPEGRRTSRRSGRKQNVEVPQDTTSPLPDLDDHQQNVLRDQARKCPTEDTSTVHANIQGNTEADQLDESKLGKVTQESTQDTCVNTLGQSQGLFSENQLLSSKDINAQTGTPCQGSSGSHVSSVEKNINKSGKKLIFKRLQKSKDHMSKFYRNSLSPSSNVLPERISGNCVDSPRASLGCEVVPPTPSAGDNSIRSSESGRLFNNRKVKKMSKDEDDLKDAARSSVAASPVLEKADSQMQKMTEESEGQSLSILAPVTREDENKSSPMNSGLSVSERESVNSTPARVDAPAHPSRDNSKKKRKLRSTPTSRNLSPEEQDAEELDEGCPRSGRTRTRTSQGDGEQNRKMQRTENIPDTPGQTECIEDTEFNNPGPETEAETNPGGPDETLPTLETEQVKMDTLEDVDESQEQHDQPISSCSDEEILPRKSRRRCFMIQDDSSSDEEPACTEMSESSRSINMTSSSTRSTQSNQSGKRRNLERDMKKLENEIAMLEAQLQEDTIVDGEVNTEAGNDVDDDDDVDIQDGSTGTASDDDLFLSPPAPSPLQTQSSPAMKSPEQLQPGLSLPELDDIPIASSLDNATSILQRYTSTSVQKMALDNDIYSAEEDNTSQENAGRKSSKRRSVKAKRKLSVLNERKSVNNQNVAELEFSDSRDDGSAMVISSSGDRGCHQSVSTTKRKRGAPSERQINLLDEPDVVVIPDSAENQKLRSPMSFSGGGNIQEREKSPTHTSRKFQFKKKEPRHDGIHRKPEWCITASGLKPEQKKLLQKFTEKLGCRATARFTPETTHVIFKACDEVPLTCQRTLKYFQGIAGGAWILAFQWLEDSLQQDLLLPEDNYEIRGDESCGPDHEGPRRSRTATKRLLEKYQILFYGSFVNLTRGDLDGIVRMCGGDVIEGQQQFSTKRNITRVVVMESRSEDEEEQQLIIPRNLLRIQQKFPDLQIVSLHWLLDSVSQYEVIEPSVYSIID